MLKNYKLQVILLLVIAMLFIGVLNRPLIAHAEKEPAVNDIIPNHLTEDECAIIWEEDCIQDEYLSEDEQNKLDLTHSENDESAFAEDNEGYREQDTFCDEPLGYQLDDLFTDEEPEVFEDCDEPAEEEQVFDLAGVFAFESNILSIENSLTAVNINTNIQDAINSAQSGDIITVDGLKTNENAEITLNIPEDVTVEWNAISKNLSFAIDGGGTFEVAAEGIIEVNDTAIRVAAGNVIVSGGKVLASGDYNSAIEVIKGNVLVSGGQVSISMDYCHYCYAICVGEVFTSGATGTVSILGGHVSATCAYFGECSAISLANGGLAAYLAGTCSGGLEVFGTGIIVEVEALDIPSTYGGTANGLTHKAGDVITNVKWNISATKPVISFLSGTFTIEWGISGGSLPTSDGKGVRIKETGSLFQTVNEAITAAGIAGLSIFTLEIIGDTTETSDVIVTANITIVGDEGEHCLTLSSPILVKEGGQLNLGNGSDTNHLTILGSVNVTNGNIDCKNGITIRSGNYALNLSGINAGGTISGGRFEGKTAINIEKGAKLSQISDGVFTGKQDTIHLTDAGTRIDLISGGIFYQTDAAITLHGHVLFVQNDSQIGKISGGYFEATKNCVLVVIRSGWVEEISNGIFVVNRVGSFANDDRNAVVWIESENNRTGIGTISGGNYSGGYFGVLVINRYSPGALIEKINGGVFMGIIGLQNDVNCYIDEISGGQFIGSQGIMNAGNIGKIGGEVEIYGSSSYGIYNYRYSQIDEIAGGLIVSEKENGIANSGTIKLISGGMIIGYFSAISCTGINPGRLETISNGVFWGKNSPAISINYELQLEPGLNTLKGLGRYWGKNGVIFNNESLVVYPDHARTSAKYKMSSATEPVTGINDVEFKYLMFDAPVSFKSVTVNNSYADISGAGVYEAGNNVVINAGLRNGYDFAGWRTDDGVVFDDMSSLTTSFTMPAIDVTVWAIWTQMPGFWIVSVENSYADYSGAGSYHAGELVTVHAGNHYGYAFSGWRTDDSMPFDGENSKTISFTMPNENIMISAIWSRMPGFNIVTVENSYTENNGAGGYLEGMTVTITAGSRRGYDFVGWKTADDVILDDMSSQTTSFTMPAFDVTISAIWTQLPGFWIVSVQNSYAENSGAGGYLEGMTVTVDAGSRSGYDFAGWIIDNGVVLANTNNQSTTFTMPAHNVTISANWYYNGADSSGNDKNGDDRNRDENLNILPIIAQPTVTPVEPQIEPLIEETPESLIEPTIELPDPPKPANGGNLIPGDNGRYIEISNDGIPKGEWHWDEELGVWIFDEYAPLGGFPQTGRTSSSVLFYYLLGLSLAGIAILFRAPLKTSFTTLPN
ncbi:MAG: InlB B-repeat-containing protein [Firmicutes bacterium]|nr:InlB B-repeat-containing protein [Bacillota bacterium]